MIRLWQDPILGVDLNPHEEKTSDLKRWLIVEHKALSMKFQLGMRMVVGRSGNWEVSLIT